MDFLYKLYDMEYFAVGLLIVIAILVFLFLLILFFGKKDEKKRILEETKKLELQNGFKEVEDQKEELVIPEISQPTLESDTKENEIIKPNFEEPINNEVSNFEIPVINENEVKENEESKVNDIDTLFQTKMDEPIPNFESEEEIVELPKIDEELYETDKISKVEDPDLNNVELPKMEEQPVKKSPVAFELPKMADMPKLKEENNESNVEKISDFDSLFGNIETETYSIKK